MKIPEPLARLIENLKKFPGIGEKSAQRIAFHILNSPAGEAEELAESIVRFKKEIKTCSVCCGITGRDPCRICDDPDRDGTVICVVEEPHNVLAIERGVDFKGKYHVLRGALSPMKGIGPEELKIKELLARLKDGKAKEILVATNPTIEGEATALYLAKLIKPLGVKVTRIASGLPVGGDLEYTDSVTMSRAIEGRREM